MNRRTSWPSWSRKYSAIDACEAHAGAHAGRFVHLAENEHRLVDDAGPAHVAPQVVPFAGAFAHAGEHGEAAVLGGDVTDQLHDHNGLAHAGAAVGAHLATPGER